jgi:hypothetical protein
MKGLTLGFVVICGLDVAMAAQSAPKSLEIARTSTISSDNPGTPLGETWLASNPGDPRNMIAVSMAFPKEGPWASVMYYTQDGGESWHRVTHGPSREAYFWGADPVVVFGSDGTAYYSDLEWGSIGNAPFDEEASGHDVHTNVFMYRSLDGGVTWSEPIALYGNDHASIAVDESQGKYRGRVYVSYTTTLHSAQGQEYTTLALAYSDDDGLSYRQRIFQSPDMKIAEQVKDGPSPTDLLVAPDGTVLLAYIHNLKPQAPLETGKLVQEIWVMSSVDGGRTFSEPQLAARTTFPDDPTTRIVLHEAGYWPKMAVDASNGPNRGRLYLAYEDYADKRARIMVRSSSDLGRSWNEPVQVNDDHSEASDNTPGVAVSGTGVVGIAWYDRRNDPRGLCFQEMFSASLDGGATFLPNQVVHRSPTCTLRAGNWQPNVSQYLHASHGTYAVTLSSPGPRFMNGGETQGVIGFHDGRFQLAWINGASGVMQMSSTAVSVGQPPLGMDVGDLIQLHTTLPTLDVGARTITMQCTVANHSRRTLKGPLVLVLSRADSVFEQVRAVNADNGLTGRGATWQLAGASEAHALRPGETVGPVTLRFEFKKAPSQPWDGATLDVNLHVFEGGT